MLLVFIGGFVTLFGILIPQGFPVKQVPGGDFRVALISGYLLAAVGNDFVNETLQSDEY